MVDPRFRSSWRQAHERQATPADLTIRGATCLCSAMSTRNTVRYRWTHPLTAGNRLRAFVDFARWQVGSRLLPGPAVVPFVADTQLVVERGMTAATGNLYAGLHEPESMGFVLHFLRPNDLFVDVGANVGTYTVLASGAAGSRSVAFEPIPLTFARLSRNVAINALGDRVDARREGVGAAPGRLLFSTDRDTNNHVLRPGEPGSESALEVPVTTLDTALEGLAPTLLKIDVERMEVEVLRGGPGVLASPSLLAISMELTPFRGYDLGEVVGGLVGQGWTRVGYDPLTRRMWELAVDAPFKGNLLFVRDPRAASERLATAPRYRIRGMDL